MVRWSFLQLLATIILNCELANYYNWNQNHMQWQINKKTLQSIFIPSKESGVLEMTMLLKLYRKECNISFEALLTKWLL